MMNKADIQGSYEPSCIMNRAGSLLLDYLIWYLIYAVMILCFFIKNNGLPSVTGNLMYYKDAFDIIIKTPFFSLSYLGILLILEIVITLTAGGQTLTKKIFKIKIAEENNSRTKLAIRNIIRLVILNPFGVIAYLIGNAINSEYINSISDILSIIFIISVLLVCKGKKPLHDVLTDTYVKAA